MANVRSGVDVSGLFAGNIQWYQCHKKWPFRWLHPNGYGTLGYALPAAIGAKLGAPERPIVTLVGDAGLLFTVQELATAVDEGLCLPILLWNNNGLGQIRDDMIAQGIAEIGVNPRNPDYIALARAFGCRTAAPGGPEKLGAALEDALAHSGPTLIEMRESGIKMRDPGARP